MTKHGARGPCPALAVALAAVVLSSGAPALAADLPDIATPALASPAPTVDPAARDCLAQAVYYEARGEPRTGREAVAMVVMNRLHDPAYPKTVCGVVFQGAGRATGCQFTFTCDGSLARGVREPASWQDALAVAGDALSGRVASPVGAATHYHALWVQPAWSQALSPVSQIGGHRFYLGGPGGRRVAVAAPLVQVAAPRAAAFSAWGLQVAVVEPAGGLSAR